MPWGRITPLEYGLGRRPTGLACKRKGSGKDGRQSRKGVMAVQRAHGSASWGATIRHRRPDITRVIKRTARDGAGPSRSSGRPRMHPPRRGREVEQARKDARLHLPVRRAPELHGRDTLHRSHTPLQKWFYAMYLFTTTAPRRACQGATAPVVGDRLAHGPRNPQVPRSR